MYIEGRGSGGGREGRESDHFGFTHFQVVIIIVILIVTNHYY